MKRNLLSKLRKRPAVAAIALVLVSNAIVCLAGTEGQTKHSKPASHHTTYYQDKVGNSNSAIQWAPVGKPSNFVEP